MKLGFIGLGNMGLNMVRNLVAKGNDLVVWNRSEGPRNEAKSIGADSRADLNELVSKLNPPRIIFSMISAGEPVDQILFGNGENSLFELLENGDIFIDGANSHYKDSKRRAEKLAEKNIKMLDAGISGGIEGARNGLCAMVGGDEEAFKNAESLFRDLSREGGYGYFGNSGAGHFVKMIHNAIEYGMMQSIAEGLNLLEASDYKQDLKKLVNVWNNGSIIQSRLLEFLRSALEKNQAENLPAEIGSLGTGKWASIEALQKDIPFGSITNAVFNRHQSRGNGNFAFKLIQLLRSEFGGHKSEDRED